jgi:hypothetical protein
MAKGLKSTKSKPRNSIKVIKTIVKSKNKKPMRKSAPGSVRSVFAASSIAAAVDASTLQHIPSHIPMGPYTVIKSRVIIPVSTNLAAQRTVLLLGAYGRASTFDQSIGPLVAILGVGTNAPGTAETIYTDPAIATYDGTSFSNGFGNANLHALTVVINCTSSATTASGLIYFGAVNQRINRAQFAQYNVLADALIPRREFSSASAYSLCTAPYKMSAYPVDLTDWSTQKPLVEPAAALGDNIALDSLSQMAIIFPPTAAAVDYTITVYTEWRVNFTDPVLSSTSVKRDPASPNLWDRIIDVGSKTAGAFHTLDNMGLFNPDNVGRVGNAYKTMSSMAGTLGTLGTAAKFL